VVNYLIDSSAWFEFFRATGSPANVRLRALIVDEASSLLGCPPVRMELAFDPHDLRRHRILAVYDGFPSAGVYADDFDTAADIYRSMRASGHTPRSITDCLIAAIGLRVAATVVHNDVDFDRIASAVPDLSVLRLPTA
jgi:predicted nucleic acid-binding protein